MNTSFNFFLSFSQLNIMHIAILSDHFMFCHKDKTCDVSRSLEVHSSLLITINHRSYGDGLRTQIRFLEWFVLEMLLAPVLDKVENFNFIVV